MNACNVSALVQCICTFIPLFRGLFDNLCRSIYGLVLHLLLADTDGAEYMYKASILKSHCPSTITV